MLKPPLVYRIIQGADDGLWTIMDQNQMSVFSGLLGFATWDDAFREIESLARAMGGITSTIRYLNPPEFRGEVMIGFPAEALSFDDEVKAAEAVANA